MSPSSTDHLELPDGRLVCASHGLVRCGKCCVDYSFVHEVNKIDSQSKRNCPANPRSPAQPSSSVTAGRRQEPSNLREPTAAEVEAMMHQLGIDDGPPKGTGRVFPTKFVPPSHLTPQELFSGRRKHIKITKFTIPRDRGAGLIYTDGACLDSGKTDPRAGWAFWHGLDPEGKELVASARLEKKGPYGDEGAQTSSRAELRAVIAALRFRHWAGEGSHTLVFATDSEYVVEGATNWARKWVDEHWTRRARSGSRKRVEVKNKDLWLALLGEVEKFKDMEMNVLFWRIPREWNSVADKAAKAAAEGGGAPEDWVEMMGLNI